MAPSWRDRETSILSHDEPALSDQECAPIVSGQSASQAPRRNPRWFGAIFGSRSQTAHRHHLVVAFDASGGDAGRSNLPSSTGTFWLSSLT
jgi:hypothetical protein